MRPRVLCALLCALLAAMAPAPAAAQSIVEVPDTPGDLAPRRDRAPAHVPDDAHRPDSAGRVVADYDFEEQFTNPLAVPYGWVRGQNDPGVPRERPGFPLWNAAQLDYESPAYGGVGTVHLPAKGDSTSLMLIPGVLSVFAEGDYLASAVVRTEGLVHARAQLVARLLDETLAPIEGAESRSPLVTSEGRWTRLEAPITGGHEGASFLQLELLVLQPEQYDPIPPEAAFRVAPEDYAAAAWFDNVGVIAIPRIEIVPDAPASFAVGDKPPALDLLVRDLAGQAIRVETVVRDLDGQLIDRIDRDMPGGRYVEHWSPALPAYGWYRATMTVHAGGNVVGAATSAFAWAPDAPAETFSIGASTAAPTIALVAGSLPDTLARELPRMARLVGATGVDISLWDGATPPDERLPDRIAPLIDRLLLDQVSVTLSFSGAPAQVASSLNIDRDDILGMLAADADSFNALADPLLDRYGQRIQRWGLGAPHSAAPFGHANLAAVLDRAESEIARMVTSPSIDIPWRTDQAIAPALRRKGLATTIHVVPGTPPDVYAQLASDWAASRPRTAPAAHDNPQGLTVCLEALDEHSIGVRAAGADLARHALAFWHAFSADEGSPSNARLALLDPWRLTDPRRPRIEPSPGLPVLRTLSQSLRGRRVALQLPLGEGVHALLLEPAAGAATEHDAAIAIWADTPRVIDVHLGEGELTQIDLFANRSPVEDAPPADEVVAPAARISIGPEPVFIEGVDATLVRALSSISLSPALLAGDVDEHALTLTMTNPWAQPIQGAVYILEPGGFADPDTPVDRSWRIAPRKVPFSLDPGQTPTRPVIVAHSLAEEAGVKPVVIDIHIVTDRDRGVHRVARTLEVGLPGVQLDLATRRSPPDETNPFVAIDAVVTNTTPDPISFDLLVVAPGQPRLRRHVSDLMPGESAARTFAFQADDSFGDARIAVSLERTDRPGRLNRTVLVE